MEFKEEKENAKIMKLQLNSPVGSTAIEYKWSDDDANDIVNLIRLTTTEFPQLSSPLRENYLKRFDTNKYKSMLNLCAYFNRIMVRRLILYKDLPETSKARPSEHLVKGILQYVYDSKRSNCSRDDFRESCFLFICQLIDDAKLTENDTFIVLGSGIVKFVLQVAALSPCKLSLGIETLNIFTKFSDRLCLSFQKLLQWFGKPFGEFELIEGDFFQEEHRAKIITGKLIFIYDLTGELDLRLKLMKIFLDLENGTLVVSSESFIDAESSIEIGKASAIGVIKSIYEIKTFKGNGDSIYYYLHEINSTQVKEYFQTVDANKNCTINEIIVRKELTGTKYCLDSDFEVDDSSTGAKYKQQMELLSRKMSNDRKISQSYIGLKTVKLFNERKELTETSKSKIAHRISKKPDLNGDGFKKLSKINNSYKINTKTELHKPEKSNMFIESPQETLAKTNKCIKKKNIFKEKKHIDVGSTISTLNLDGKSKSNKTLKSNLPRRFSKRLLKGTTELPKSNMKLLQTQLTAINKKNKKEKKRMNIISAKSVTTKVEESRLKSKQINGSCHFERPENCSQNALDHNFYPLPELNKPLKKLKSDTEQVNWNYIQKSAAPHFNYKEALSKSQSIHKTDKSYNFQIIRHDYKPKPVPISNSNKILNNYHLKNKDNETFNSSFKDLPLECLLDRYQILPSDG